VMLAKHSQTTKSLPGRIRTTIRHYFLITSQVVTLLILVQVIDDWAL
jgi:hypothetical protein